MCHISMISITKSYYVLSHCQQQKHTYIFSYLNATEDLDYHNSSNGGHSGTNFF